MENANSPEYLEKIKNAVIENLKKTIPAPPSVQMQDVPRQGLGQSDEDEAELDDEDEDQNKDSRWTERRLDKHTIRDDEFEESGDEEMAEANGAFRPKGGSGRKRITDHKNPFAQPDYEEVTANGHEAETAQTQVEEEGDNHDGDETMEDVGAEIEQAPETEVQVETEPTPQVTEGAVEADKDGDVDMTEVNDIPAPAIKQEDADMQPSAASAELVPTAGEPQTLDKPTEEATDSNPPVAAAGASTDDEVLPTTTAIEPPEAEENKQDKPVSPAKSVAPAEDKPAAEDVEPASKPDDVEPPATGTSVEKAKED